MRGITDRRRPRVLALLVALVAALALVAAACSGGGDTARTDQSESSDGSDGAEPAAGDKPNVVVVMTDDQWLESMKVMERTNQRFGAEGVTFENYHPSTPICCPSRSTYLSGQFAHNNGVRHNSAPEGGYDKLDEDNTLPVWMQKAGYATSHIGKYPNGYGRKDETHVPPGWTEWRGSVDPTTYQMWGYRLNENGKLRTYGEFDQEDPELYQTDVYRDKGVDFIERQSEADKPFFLSMAFLAPHSENMKAGGAKGESKDKDKGKGKGAKDSKDAGKPQVGSAPRPAPRHEGAFEDEPLPEDPAYGEEDVSDKPAFLRDYPKLTEKTTAAITESYQGRLASLLAVDEAVEKLVRTLEETGELDNTYLMFTADNGFFFGEHRIPTGKFLPHGASGQVPMMIRGPGLTGGEKTAEASNNADLTATVADIADAKPTLTLDGRSMLPYAEDPDASTDRPILQEGGPGALPTPVDETKPGEAPPDDESAGRAAAAGDLDQDGVASPAATKKRPRHGQMTSAAYESIRTDRYLYIRYTAGGRELYDLERDPHELSSRHADPAYAEVRDYLDEHLDRLQGCEGADCQRELPPAPEPP